MGRTHSRSASCYLAKGTSIVATTQELRDEHAGDSEEAPAPAGDKPRNWKDEIDLSHIEDEELRSRVVAMLEKHSWMWDGSLGEIKATCHRVPLVDGARSHREMPRRTGPETKRKIAKEVRKMLHAGVIGPAASEWASPVVLVGKKDGSLRFCVDYRRLNMKTMTDTYRLPRMDDYIDSRGDAAVSSMLDCNDGYWQIPVDPSDREKTTFTTH